MRFPNRLCRQLIFPFIALCFNVTAFAADQYPKRPLNDRVLVALVAGGALPESIAADVRSNGLGFYPADSYLSRLKSIGADTLVMDALSKASRVTTSGESHPDDETVLEHLFVAGEKIKSKKLREAAEALGSASTSLENHPELAFVMGEIMRQEEQFAQMAALYSRLIDIDPEFPEVHAKLSYALYRSGDNEGGVAEARAALARTPDNAEAHKNMGLNLGDMKQYDAAIAEYQKALAIKPDYTAIHFDLGILYLDRGDYRNAISENRKTLASEPDNADAHYNLGKALQMADESGTAINEFREAIRLRPEDSEWRMHLANLLADTGDREGGVAEFRKLISKSPDSFYCHYCFANLLLKADRLDEAAKEYRAAIQLDKSSADAHYGLGMIFQRKNQQDEAMKEFEEASRLGYDSWGVHLEMSRIYLARKQNDEALAEVKQAISLAPSNGFIHEQLADILAASGKTDEAILEYGQAFNLEKDDPPKAANVARKSGKLHEKIGNYSAAWSAYRDMYGTFPNNENRAEYQAARTRLSAHLPKSALEDSAAPSNDPTTLTMRWAEKSREMQQAMAEKRWKDADEAGKEAIALAEQMPPGEGHLVGTMYAMAANYGMQNRLDEAEQQYLKALQVSEKEFGATNLQTMYSLSALGQFYLHVKNYPQAVAYLTRTFDLAQKLYGQTYGYELLDKIGEAYREQHMFTQAEDAYKKMLADDEIKNGPSSPSSAPGLEHLGMLYCDMGRYADAQSALERAISIDQKQFGANSPSLDRPLTELARALRGLGKEDEAKALDHRRELLAQNQAH